MRAVQVDLEVVRVTVQQGQVNEQAEQQQQEQVKMGLRTLIANMVVVAVVLVDLRLLPYQEQEGMVVKVK